MYRPARNAGAPALVPPGSVAPETVLTVDLADLATIAQVITLLSSLGVSDALLQQVRRSISPPSINKSKSIGPEKQLQILAGKINVLEQQLAKLVELDVCHSQFAGKSSQMEDLRAQYRELRDTGRFTPTPTSLVPSVAVSVNSEHEQNDTIGANSGLGTADAGAEGTNAEQPNAPNVPVPMDEALLRPVLCQAKLARGGRCVEAHVGLLRSGRSLLGGGRRLRISVDFS